MSITANTRPYVSEGMPVTYIGTPNICTYWQVVGVVLMVEGTPIGSLSERIIVTDNDGRAVNEYLPSIDTADAGKTERIKVTEGA